MFKNQRMLSEGGPGCVPVRVDDSLPVSRFRKLSTEGRG